MLCVDALDIVYSISNDGVERAEDGEGHGEGRELCQSLSRYITTQIVEEPSLSTGDTLALHLPAKT